MTERVLSQSGKSVMVATLDDVNGEAATIPVATTTSTGVVKVGTNLAVASDGTISVPVAGGSKAGVVMIGSGISYNTGSGEISVAKATSDTTAGVKQGVAVANAAGDTVTAAEFLALLTSLRNAGIIAS